MQLSSVKKSAISLIGLLSDSEKKKGKLVIFLSLVVGIFEVLGMVSVMPFIALASTPEIIHENYFLNWAYEYFGFSKYEDFLILSGIIMFFIILVSLALKSINLYAQQRYLAEIEAGLTTRLFYRYICQDYEWFSGRSLADFNKNIFTDISGLVGGVAAPWINMLSHLFLTALIIVLLTYIDPLPAIFSFLILVVLYISLYQMLKRLLYKIGSDRLALNARKYLIFSETFGSVKQSKFYDIEYKKSEDFSRVSIKNALLLAKASALKAIPRLFLELIAFGGVILFILYYLSTANTLSDVLPILAVYVFAGYRLIPAVQQIFAAFASLRISTPLLNSIVKEFSLAEHLMPACPAPRLKTCFTDNIAFTNVSYKYPGEKYCAICDINVKIKKGKKIAIIGASGSGKSTFIDLLLGLRTPSSGSILLDGVPFENNTMSDFRQNIGYLPQDVFLYNDTIANNVALHEDEIDFTRIKSSMSAANIDSIIGEYRLDVGIGDNGSKLSGGQRQRIGLARALYRNPDILVADEPTSALDSDTTNSIIDFIFSDLFDKTTIIVTHDLELAKRCDYFYLFERGRIVSGGGE